MKRVNTGSKAKKDPDSRINKSLRKWNCKCSNAATKQADAAYVDPAMGAVLGAGLGGAFGYGNAPKGETLKYLLAGAGLGGMAGGAMGLGRNAGAYGANKLIESQGLTGNSELAAQYGLPLAGMLGGGLLSWPVIAQINAEVAEESRERASKKEKIAAFHCKCSAAREFAEKLAQQQCAPGQPCAPAAPQYSKTPFDANYARAAFDQHKIHYSPNATDQQLYNLYMRKGKIAPGSRPNPFQAMVGAHHGNLPPAPLQPQVSPGAPTGLVKTQADNSMRAFGSKMAELMLPSSGGASSSLATPSIDALLKDTTPMPPPAPKKPLVDLDAVSKNLTPLIQADSNRPTLAKSPSPLDPPALHPALGGKPLTRAEIIKNPDPVAGVTPVSAKKPAPATSTAQKPENALPASSPAAPSAKPSRDWSGVAAAGGLSAAGLLALYYMMQERNKPKKRREDDE